MFRRMQEAGIGSLIDVDATRYSMNPEPGKTVYEIVIKDEANKMGYGVGHEFRFNINPNIPNAASRYHSSELLPISEPILAPNRPAVPDRRTLRGAVQ